MAGGRGAYLLDMERSDILAMSVGNLAPGQEAVVEIDSVSTLPVAHGVMRFQLPTTVSPRYAPADADPVDIDRISPPVSMSVPYRLELDVRVLADAGSEIRSPSHEITVKSVDGWKVVTPAQQLTSLDRDFILETVTKASRAPQCLVSRHANGDRAAVLCLFPELDAPEGHGGDGGSSDAGGGAGSCLGAVAGTICMQTPLSILVTLKIGDGLRGVITRLVLLLLLFAYTRRVRG